MDDWVQNGQSNHWSTNFLASCFHNFTHWTKNILDYRCLCGNSLRSFDAESASGILGLPQLIKIWTQEQQHWAWKFGKKVIPLPYLLLGKKIGYKTDHKPLQYILCPEYWPEYWAVLAEVMTGRSARWPTSLAAYDYDVQYEPGGKIAYAVSMSVLWSSTMQKMQKIFWGYNQEARHR